MTEKYDVINEVDEVTVNLTTGQMSVRRATRFLEGGTEIGKTYHRHPLVPGDDLKKQDPRVVAIAEVVWTPGVVSAFKAVTERAVKGDA